MKKLQRKEKQKMSIKTEELKKGTKVKLIKSGIVVPVTRVNKWSFVIDMPVVGEYEIFESQFDEFEIHSQPEPKKQIILTMSESQFNKYVKLYGDYNTHIRIKNIVDDKAILEVGDEIESFEIKEMK